MPPPPSPPPPSPPPPSPPPPAVPLLVSAGASLDSQLEQLHTPALEGQIAEIALQLGTHASTNATAFVFDASVTASEVLVTGTAGAAAYATTTSGLLFDVVAGAPRVTLRGLTINSPIHVAGGELVVESCLFEGCIADAGGAAPRGRAAASARRPP